MTGEPAPEPDALQQLQRRSTSDLLEMAASAMETHPMLRYTNIVVALRDRAARLTAEGF